MGITGVGIAYGVSNAMIFIAINLFPLFVPELKDAIQYPTWETFHDLKPYFGKGIPLACLILCEWMAYDIQIVLSGYMGITEQSCNIVQANITLLFFGLA
jgi:Na+-driven multidrug efflux pump